MPKKTTTTKPTRKYRRRKAARVPRGKVALAAVLTEELARAAVIDALDNYGRIVRGIWTRRIITADLHGRPAGYVSKQRRGA